MTAAVPGPCECGHSQTAHPVPTDCVRCTCTDYRPAVRRGAVPVSTGSGAYTAAQIEAVLGIPPSTLRVWAYRGHITKLGRDLYDGDSVIAHWRQQTEAAEARDARSPAPL